MRALARQYSARCRHRDACGGGGDEPASLRLVGPGRSAAPWTGEIRAQLARALALAPRHPGANHYWIHLMEARRSRRDGARERRPARDAGARLRPSAAHAGAHLHARRPLRATPSRANERSIAADARYLAQVDAQRAYRVGYVAHNHHFLWAAAAMEGRSARRARRRARRVPRRLRPGPQRPQHRHPAALLRAARCTRWCASGAGARSSRRRCRPTWTSRTRSRSGTTRAAPPLRRPARLPRPAASWPPLERLAADPRLAQARIKNINPRMRWYESRGSRWPPTSRWRKVAPTPPSRRCRSHRYRRRPRLRRAASVARADAARARRGVARGGAARRRGARLPRGSRALSGQRLVACRACAKHSAGRARRGAAAATDSASTAAWRDADIVLTGSRF